MSQYQSNSSEMLPGARRMGMGLNRWDDSDLAAEEDVETWLQGGAAPTAAGGGSGDTGGEAYSGPPDRADEGAGAPSASGGGGSAAPGAGARAAARKRQPAVAAARQPRPRQGGSGAAAARGPQQPARTPPTEGRRLPRP